MGKKKGGGGKKGSDENSGPSEQAGSQQPAPQQPAPQQPAPQQQSGPQQRPAWQQQPPQEFAQSEFPSFEGGGQGRGRNFRGQRGGEGGFRGQRGGGEGGFRGQRGGGEGGFRGQRGGEGGFHGQRGGGERGGGQRGRGDGGQQTYTPTSYPEQTGSGPGGNFRGGEGGRGGGRGRGGQDGRGGGRGRGRGEGDQQSYRQEQPRSYEQPPSQATLPPPQQEPVRPPASTTSPGDELAASVAQIQISPPKPSTTGGNGKSGGVFPIPERQIIADKQNQVGKRGRPIEIEVNHLLLGLKKSGLAIHYDCSFKPDVPKKMLRMAIEQIRLKHFPNRWPAFDGRKNLYSYGELPFGNQMRDTVQVTDEERSDGKPKEFDITIKRVSQVDLGQIQNYSGRQYPQDAIQVLDIVLRHPSSLRFTPVGRSYFTPPSGQVLRLGNGLELWYGFYQSAILGWKPFLNVDVAHKGFPEGKNLLDVMLEVKGRYVRYNEPPPEMRDLQSKGLGRMEQEDFAKFIRGLKVEYMLPQQPNTRRVFKVNGVRAPCSEYRFKLDDGRSITIGEYFQKEKRYALRFPNLPCIHVGNPQKDICLPPELCKIVPGQVVNRKLDETQTANMVRAAARPADERKARIMDAMKRAGFNQDPCMNEFGVTVDDKFQRIRARILDSPPLEYGNGRQVRANKGVWRADKFLSSMKLERWAVIGISGRMRDNVLHDFARTMISQGQSLGMQIAPPCEVFVISDRINNGDQLKRLVLPVFEKFKKNNLQLVVVSVPDRPPDAYSKIKLAAEVSVGLLTQCVKENTMTRKMNPATAGNILLKINAKLNGINHAIVRCPVMMDKPTMLVGADVTHPSPDQTAIPSVAAVAASHDRRGFMYNMIWKLQGARVEIIQDLEAIMRAQLMFFHKKTNGVKPEKIIFYRDGVSEGQFQQVLQSELTAIRRACTSLNENYKPGITFLVVQKRHHTRFFPTRREDEDGKNKNVPAGTIVDTVITHPREMDFYLVSHASLQGTSRPTKYHKLWDDLNISEDDLEELTYYLCHLFSRCTRSVSYPAPTYYAHLAAFRGRVYLEGSNINMTNLQNEMTIRTIQDTIVLNSPMFFV